MSIHDPQIEVVCDGEDCRQSIFVTPEYKYRNMSEHSGFYACDDDDLEPLIEREDWTVVDGKQFCESCSEDE